MRKTRFLLILLSLCFLLGCNSAVPEGSEPPSTNETAENSALQMPDGMKEYAEDPGVQWMAGMLAVLENSEMIRGISSESFEVYADPGDVVQAEVTVQNGLDMTQRYDLMVFSDGLPIEFTVDGKQYQSYPIDLTPQQKTVEITFEKEFDLNLGRLDFVMSFAGNPQGTYHLVSYPIWVDLDTEAVQPTALCGTVEQRAGLQESFTGETYGAWLWNEGVVPAETDNIGAKTISFQSKEAALLEAIAAKPGLYRTVLVVNGDPVSFESNGEQYFWLDWESTGTNMLQLPVRIADMPPSGSIYTITTPLDADALVQLIAASGRIELIENGEE